MEKTKLYIVVLKYNISKIEGVCYFYQDLVDTVKRCQMDDLSFNKVTTKLLQDFLGSRIQDIL